MQRPYRDDRRARRVAVILALTTLAVVSSVGSAVAAHNVTPARVEGETRVDTAANLSALTGPASTAILARADDFPDALAAAALAGAADAPILLTHPDRLPDRTRARLAELGVRRVYLLGGTAAISSDVEEELRGDYDVTRLSGPTRYGTAAAVAREVARIDEVGTVAGLRTAFVASGDSFADALAAGSPATTQVDPFPILLVARDTYPQETEAAIADLGIEQAIVVGGPAAVSEHVERHLREDVGSVLRLSGPTRLDTAVAVADFAMLEFAYRGELVVLARGDDFPDALAAGLHAGRSDAPILLTADPDTLGGPAETWINDACPVVDVVRAVGGTSAVATETLAHAVTAGEECHGQRGTVQTYVVAPQQPRSTTAGATVDFAVGARYDDRPLVGPLDVALFPCEAVELDEPLHFHDADGDGDADAIASSETGSAVITRASEATRIDGQYAHNAQFLHGALSVSVDSDAPDCAVVVVFDDLDGRNQLPVDAAGHPLEHVGVGQVIWGP